MITSVRFPLLNDKVQLFAYVDEINEDTCISMYSAALAGDDDDDDDCGNDGNNCR